MVLMVDGRSGMIRRLCVAIAATFVVAMFPVGKVAASTGCNVGVCISLPDNADNASLKANCSCLTNDRVGLSDRSCLKNCVNGMPGNGYRSHSECAAMCGPCVASDGGYCNDVGGGDAPEMSDIQAVLFVILSIGGIYAARRRAGIKNA